MKIMLQFLLHAIILQTLANAFIGLLFYSLLWFRTKAMLGFLVLCAIFKLAHSYPGIIWGGAAIALVTIAVTRTKINDVSENNILLFH